MSVHLPADASSAFLARRFVEATLSDQGLQPSPDLVLLTSELVTNSVIHAMSEVDLRIRLIDHHIRVEVTDASDVMPVPKNPSALATSGRGLRIVDSLSDHWGVDVQRGTGKVTWFELTVQASGGSRRL